MDDQIAKVKQQYNSLSQQEQQSLSGGSSSVGAIGGTGAAVTAVNVALSKQGSTYVFGAKGPNQFDCSGLVAYAYKQAGIELPASTKSQVSAGKSVSQSDLKPGDVIFFLQFGQPRRDLHRRRQDGARPHRRAGRHRRRGQIHGQDPLGAPRRRLRHTRHTVGHVAACLNPAGHDRAVQGS